MFKLITNIFIFLVIHQIVWTQTQDIWIYFKDKPLAAEQLLNPTDFLSQKSIDRRIRYNIPFDLTDAPIDQDYFNTVSQVEGIEVIAKSKWLNGMHLRVTSEALTILSTNESIMSIQYLDHTKRPIQRTTTIDRSKKLDVITFENYGTASNQIDMLNGRILHDNGFTGRGMQIAVIDAGFINVNTMGAFQRLRDNNQILGTYNFIENTTNVYGHHYHGTMVLSTLAGYIENEYIGMAPDASYYLFLTEDASQEHPYEESLWIEAAEKADSLGVDVLTTSLGYTEFDNPAYNHTYDDLDGNTTIISRGSKIATEKGMLVINSAGNWGNNLWHYIGAPADVENVLSIGAVDPNGIIASFSSWGPTSDGRLKPDVCAQGAKVSVINTSNEIVSSNGTSFSGPIIAGLATCLWQAYPNETPQKIRDIIKKSSHKYNSPDNHYGYGIPNFETAFGFLNISDIEQIQMTIYPNPVKRNSILNITVQELSSITKMYLYDLQGKLIKQSEISKSNYYLETSNINPGMYFLHLANNSGSKTFKLLITNDI